MSIDTMIRRWHSLNSVWMMMEKGVREISETIHSNVTNPNTTKYSSYYTYIGLFRLDTMLVTPIDIFDAEAAIPAFRSIWGFK